MTEEKETLPVSEAAETVNGTIEAAQKTADEVSEAVKAGAEATETALAGVEAAATEAATAVKNAEETAEAVTDKAEQTAEAALADAGKAETPAGGTEALAKEPATAADHFKNIMVAAGHTSELTPIDATPFVPEGVDASEFGKEKEESSATPAIFEEPPVILFDHVHKEYEGQLEDSVALTDVSFSIKKGEFVFITGPSGSGKSTMIRLMMREISPSAGKIYIAGKELAKLRRRHVSKYRRNIGIVFQDFRLLPDRNVYDNVAFAQRVVGAPKRNIPKEVSKVLHLVGLSQKYKSFPNELSGGEQQRVAIARALVNNPMIILADEPTGNLDPQNSYEIMSLLEEINRRGTTVVIVTHDREVVNRMQKRVVALHEGTIVEDKKGGYSRG